MRLSVELAQALNARVTGSHVYAAALHDVRFKQMEFTLPDEYKEETELEKQRRIHDALITRGLQLISDSYLAPMAALSDDLGVPYEGKTFDGKNFEELVHDVEASDYDLMVMGALGVGAVKQSQAGSVCERVLRRTEVDSVVIRQPEGLALDSSGDIMVALDGSEFSWGALKAAARLAEATGRDVEVVSVHEPGRAGEELLEAHLSQARRYLRKEGLKARTTSLDGAAAETLMQYARDASPWLLAVGRYGIDALETDPSLGTVTEHLIRGSDVNLLVAGGRGRPEGSVAASQAA